MGRTQAYDSQKLFAKQLVQDELEEKVERNEGKVQLVGETQQCRSVPARVQLVVEEAVAYLLGYCAHDEEQREADAEYGKALLAAQV